MSFRQRSGRRLLPLLSLVPLASFGLPGTPSSASAQEGAMWSSGLTLATAVLFLLIAALAYALLAVLLRFAGRTVPAGPPRLTLLVPVLAGLGLVVAGYLSYVETQAVPAMCGPIGDCNTVQTSSYARLFGLLPVGVLGAAGYIVILATWLWGRLRNDRLTAYVPLALAALSAFGAAYSTYLTYVEVFILRAVCMWCLASAVIMAALLVLTIGPAIWSVTLTHLGRVAKAELLAPEPSPPVAAERSSAAAQRIGKQKHKKRTARKGGGR